MNEDASSPIVAEREGGGPLDACLVITKLAVILPYPASRVGSPFGAQQGDPDDGATADDPP
jgi:hypothetical protein